MEIKDMNKEDTIEKVYIIKEETKWKKMKY
jgi:hypothetical protein